MNEFSPLNPDDLTETQRAALAAVMARKKAEKTQDSGDDVPRIGVDPANRNEPFPLTDIQQAQWFGRSGLFDIAVAGHGYVEFDCKGMDLERLTRAFQIIIDRHPQMRIVCKPDLTQVVLNDLDPYEFALTDLRGKSEAEVEAGLAEIRERMSHDIIDATTWPIYEVAATRWGEDELRIHFSFDLLVGDAWCFRTIIDEWARLYDDPANMRPIPEELTYRDYVMGFEKIEKSPLFDRSLAYWLNQLDDLPPAPNLPMIRQPADLDEIRAQHFSILFDGAEWTRLRTAIKSRGLTPSAFFAAAFSEVIALWNDAPRHTLNVTVFNPLPVHEDIGKIMVGEFNSFMLLDCDNSAAGTFEGRAQRAQNLLWNHLDHRWVTGVRLMRELSRVKGVTAGEALMPVVFTSTIAHHKGETDIPTRYPGKWIYEVSQTPQVWMEHHLWEEGDSLSLHIDVVEGLFPAGLIEDFVATYEKLLRDLMDDPAAWQRSDASHLLPDSYDALLQDYNDTAADIPADLLHAGFLSAATRYGAKTAVVSACGNRSYAELDGLSNQLGHALQDIGEKPGDLVAVICPKGWEQIAAVLGVLKAGAAYLPIEADYPTDRIHAILADAGVTTVLGTSDTLETLSLPASMGQIAVDAPLATPDTLPDQPATTDDLAYVIYTSGSTGKPKGVAIRHSAAANTCSDVNARFAVGEADVVFAVSALNFDLSVWDIFGGLAAGAKLVMPTSQTPEPREWLELAEEHGVTVWNSVPALAEMFVTYAEDTGRIVPDSLRLAMMSGDWIPLSLPPMLEMVNPEMQIISLGGATEASIWSIFHPIEGIRPEWVSIPYGRPLANQTMHVLREDLSACPPWATGEICIGGVGLADGYFGDPEKTAAAFVTHPDTGERFYRTGDLGRFNPEGHIEFLGRKDTQVKLRGYRIELGEIESAIAATGLCAQAVCMMVGEDNTSRQLAAFLTLKGTADDETLADTLRTALNDRLPPYMVPTSIKVLESIPLTANGKVDRKRLAQLANDLGKKTEFVAPRNDTEARIAEIWQELLGVETIGVHDDFFELGGNSMIASRLIIRIQDIFEVELPFSKLFEAANVADLSELVTAEVLAEIEAMAEEEA